jgi:hypothetical protein
MMHMTQDESALTALLATKIRFSHRQHEHVEPSRKIQFAINWSRAALAAIVAASAITLYMMFVPRLLGIEQMDIGITIGNMVDPSGGIGFFLARVAWHVGNGILYVFPYAFILFRLKKQSTVWTGIPFGMFLWLVGPMLLIPLRLNVNPLVQAAHLTHPGVFMLSLGLGLYPAVVDLGAHLIHGMLAGLVYKHWTR